MIIDQNIMAINIIAELQSTIAAAVKEGMLRRQVYEAIKPQAKELVREAAKNVTKDDDDTSANKRQSVMNLLKDDKFNHAELARHLWHPKDQGEEDTYRSLFSKKATGKPDSDGAVRRFNDDEINKLYELLRAK